MTNSNTGQHDQQSLNPQLLDRLVDGELSPEHYAELLARLERNPDGWRRCALAFLEAQAWKRDLAIWKGQGTTDTRGIDEQAGASSAKSPSEVVKSEMGMVATVVRGANNDFASGQGRGASRWTFSWFALAASMLFAFALGRSLNGPAMSRHALSDDVVSSAQAPGRTFADPDPDLTQFASGDFWNGRPALSPEIRESLEQRGIGVKQRHGYIPGTTPDGRSVLVPFEEVELVPVKNQPY